MILNKTKSVSKKEMYCIVLNYTELGDEKGKSGVAESSQISRGKQK